MGRKKVKKATKREKLLKKIVSYWGNPKSSGFMDRGVHSLKAHMFFDLGIQPKTDLVLEALRSIPAYLQHLPARKVKKRRRYNVLGSYLLQECDLMEMPIYNGFKYVLVLVDAFNKKIWAKAMRSKSAKTTAKAFTALFAESGRTPETLQFDAGKYTFILMRQSDRLRLKL